MKRLFLVVGILLFHFYAHAQVYSQEELQMQRDVQAQMLESRQEMAAEQRNQELIQAMERQQQQQEDQSRSFSHGNGY